MNKEQRKEISRFKDKWAQEKGYENWYDYKDHCDSHGFDEDEIGYDDLMFEYGQYMLSKLRTNNIDDDFGGVMGGHFSRDY